MKRKNLKTILLSAFVAVPMFVGGCSFNVTQPTYEKFELLYTQNLEFLVGEEWHDPLLKGTGTKKDQSKVDVTDIMTIDKSQYKKDVPGKYKINFKLEEIKLDYEVSVVNQITNSDTINSRLAPVVDNSFARVDGMLRFEASKTTPYTDFDFTEKLIYQDNDGDISAYYNWKVDDEIVFETWYLGTRGEGRMITKESDYFTRTEEFNDYSLSEYEEYMLEEAAEDIFLDVTPIVGFMDTLALEDKSFAGSLTLNNGEYTLAGTGVDLTYADNVITGYNGSTLSFKSQQAVPPATTIHELTRELIETTYQRTDGVLSFRATDEYYLDENGNWQYDEGVDLLINETVMYYDDNGQITIYTVWDINGETIELWYEGTNEAGVTTLNGAGELMVVEGVNTPELYSMCLMTMAEEAELPIGIYPIIITNLETIELSGRLTDYGNGDYYLYEYQADLGEGFSLSSNDNKITDINDFDIEFGAVTIDDIPGIPEL